MNFYMVSWTQILQIVKPIPGNSQDEGWASSVGSPDEREVWRQKSKVMATEGSLTNLWMVANCTGTAFKKNFRGFYEFHFRILITI